jgi:hypothetical protein
MKTKISAAHGSHPSKRGKGIVLGQPDVEKEKEIIENLGTIHINTWRCLWKENPYCFHERQYTSVDK